MQFLTPAGRSSCFETVLVWMLPVMDPENVRRVMGGAHGNSCFKLLGICSSTLRFSAAGGQIDLTEQIFISLDEECMFPKEGSLRKQRN
jgi:hypothetical protein